MVPREGVKVTKGKRPDDICPLMENLSQSESSIGIGETFIRGTLSKQQMGVHSLALPITYRDVGWLILGFYFTSKNLLVKQYLLVN